jgi:hypothetical protein
MDKEEFVLFPIFLLLLFPPVGLLPRSLLSSLSESLSESLLSKASGILLFLFPSLFPCNCSSNKPPPLSNEDLLFLDNNDLT